MVLYEVFSHSVKKKYRTSIFSKATVFYFTSTVFSFIIPLILAYYSRGFWKKTNVYQEQPTVFFKHQLLLLVETAEPSNGPLVWSTFPHLNSKLSALNLRPPFIKNREDDTDGDGKNDLCYLTIEVPLLDSEEVHAIQLLLIFDYSLSVSAKLKMEALAFIHHSSPLPAAHFGTVGELKLYQKEALRHAGTDARFNESVIGHDFNLQKIFTEYTLRNISTYYDYKYPVWKTGKGTKMPLVIEVIVHYPEETIVYQTGFWELLKWAWIQYICVSVVFLYVSHHIKIMIFSNRVFS